MIAVSWKPTLVVTSLLLLLTYLWLRSSSPELDRNTRLQATLRIIELRDAELTRDLLMARVGLLANYDALTKAAQDLIRLSQSLENELNPAANDADKVVGQAVKRLDNELLEKQGQAEYFKSDNALLQNSIMYFDREGKVLISPPKNGVTVKISHLWQSMFSFMKAPKPDLAQKIQADFDRLAKVRLLPKDYQALILHGRLIVDWLPKLDVLLHKIIGYPIAAQVEVLQEALNNSRREIETRAKWFRLMHYLVAVVLLGYLIYQFSQLRKNNKILRHAHDNLQREVGERLQAELALSESVRQLRAISDSAHEAIVSIDSLGNIVSWNHGASLMFDYSLSEALDSSFFRLIANHPSLPEALLMEDQWHLNLNTIEAALELTGIRQDRSEFPLELSLSSWTRSSDRYVTAIMRDISVRKQLEATTRQQQIKLIQANKMTAVGMLVSSVAHEINNPNQMILMNAGLLANAWDDAVAALDVNYREAGDFSIAGLPYSEMRKTLPVLVHDIKDGAKRIQGIVADLKNYSRPQSQNTMQAVFSLNEVAERAIRWLNHLINQKTRHFKSDLTEPLAYVRGDPQQVEQVVVNLLVNALEALPDRESSVTVSTNAMNDNREVSLEVSDEGIGIPPEHLEQLRDPFFTTKQSTGGTGLGLAITASLVRAHGGLLSFSSTPGKGTCVRAIFPGA